MDNLVPETVPDPAPPETGGSLKSFVKDMAETLLIALILFFAINIISARIRVEQISMQPTLFEGDFVIVNRLAYQLGTPGRGDIIVFRYPLDPTATPLIKRIIGLPGEKVKIENGTVYINDVPIRESYIKDKPIYNGTWYIPPGQLFVLGDNRNHSSDSHAWGLVPLENVIGKAEVVYLPVAHWQSLNPNVASAAGP